MATNKKSSAGEAKAIVVGIRVRPFNAREVKFNSSCIVSMEGNCTRIHETQNGKPLMVKPREFVFDYAFWTHSKDGSGAPAPLAGTAPPAPPPFADQQFVYERLGVQIVENVFEGFNSCLFAYGQTGSGKTYSMMGIPSDPGMLPRIGTDIFERAEGIMVAGNECTVKASFCELYNEKCRDLLAPPSADGKGSGELKIRMHPQTGVFVEGITSYTLNTPEEYFKLLERGLSHRTTASTNMNATSSRSHGIVLLTVFQKDCNGSKTGKMSLVDLAGSERMAATGATGATAVEGQNINRSLTTLGMVLSKLADRASAGDKASAAAAHIPYRDSQLTFLLMDNLGGNSKTSMIAAISPASVNYDETLSTLRFSSVAKKVKSVATVNEDPNDKLIRELKVELGELRDRLKRLQEQKRAKAAGGSVPPALAATPPPAAATTPEPEAPSTPMALVAPPPSGVITEAKVFPPDSDALTPAASVTPAPSDATATPPPQSAAPVEATAVKRHPMHVDPALGTSDEGEGDGEPHQPAEASTSQDTEAIHSIAQQIADDEGALANLQTPPLSGRKLLEDSERTRVQVTKAPAVAMGNVSAPNLLLAHHNTSANASGAYPPAASAPNSSSTAAAVPNNNSSNNTTSMVIERTSSFGRHRGGSRPTSRSVSMAGQPHSSVSSAVLPSVTITAVQPNHTNSNQQLSRSRVNSSASAAPPSARRETPPPQHSTPSRNAADSTRSTPRRVATAVVTSPDPTPVPRGVSAADSIVVEGYREGTAEGDSPSAAATTAGLLDSTLLVGGASSTLGILSGPRGVSAADSIVVEGSPLPRQVPPSSAKANCDLADSVGLVISHGLADSINLSPSRRTAEGQKEEGVATASSQRSGQDLVNDFSAAIAAASVNRNDAEEGNGEGRSRRRAPSVTYDDDDNDSDASNEARNRALLELDEAEGDDGYYGEEDEEGEEDRHEVMVDWRAPQLINLRPEAGGDVLIIPLSEGQTDCEMDDVNVYFVYDALQSVVTIFGDVSGAVFLNGVPIEDEGQVLRHNDRIVVGENAFRFAFTAQDACDFKKRAVCVEHLVLLERYERMKVVEERCRNALSMGKAYFSNLAAITGGSVAAPSMNMTPRGGSGLTPRSTNALLAAIGDDSSHTNQLIYELEQQLSHEYPADAEDLDETHITVDMTQYTEALDERARALQQQQDEMEGLRELLERQNRLAAAAASTSGQAMSPTKMRAEAAEVAVVQESINVACSEAILHRELTWHRQVKTLKAFKPSGGPSDPVDRSMWLRLDSDPPFASDPLLKLERAATMAVSDPKTRAEASKRWVQRFVACTRQFAFIFRQTNDIQPCLGAVYLPGAQITAPTERDPTDVGAPRYFVEVAPAITRSSSDVAVSSHQCSVRFGFDREEEMLAWRQFLEEASSPQMPLSMLKRWTKEFVASHGTLSVFADAAAPGNVRSEMMPARMRWKPDSSTDRCEDCRRPFILIIRGKHHCRGCGGIFCADCLSKEGGDKRGEKKCADCHSIVKRATLNAVRRAGAGTVRACRRTNIMSEFELRRPNLLRETFDVRLEIVSNPNNAETVRRLKVPGAALKAARDNGSIANSSVSENHKNNNNGGGGGDDEDAPKSMQSECTSIFDDDSIVRFQVDHYRGRAHTFTGDEIARVERSLLVPTILTLHTTDGAIIRMSFEDAMARERCIESLLVLMGCRVYMPGLRDVVEVSNVVVTNDVGEDCFFRMTNTIAVDAKLWVGVEDGRTIPFHDAYAIWAFVGHKETWSEKSLKSFRLCLLEQAQLSRDTCLYVVCSLEWRQNIMAVTPCPVSHTSRYTVGAIGVRMLESTVLFVGVHNTGIEYGDFVDAGIGGSASPRDSKLFSLGHISTTNLPIVDALQQYDHSFLINSPGLPQFTQANPVVHYNSPTVEVVLSGRSSVDLVVPCVGFTCSKFCDRPCERPVFKLLSVQVLESKSTELPADRVPKGDIVGSCQLWCSMGFDRLHEGQVVTDPSRLHGMACSAAQTSAYGEVMLVSGMADYCALGKLFVVCADVGSVAINIAQVMAPLTANAAAAPPLVSEVMCEVSRGGKTIAIAEVKMSSWWVAGYTGIAENPTSGAPSDLAAPSPRHE